MAVASGAPVAGVAAHTRLLSAVQPFDSAAILRSLAAHVIPGAETCDVAGERFTRLFPVRGGHAVVSITLRPDGVALEVTGAAPDEVDGIAAVVRRWLDLDADLPTVSRVLGEDPILGPLIRLRPGLRVIGAPDGFQAMMTVILGQQVSIAAGRTFSGRLVQAFGEVGPGGLTVFPSAQTLAALTPDTLREAIGLTGARAQTLHTMAVAAADGLELSPEADRTELRRRLLALRGIGPWTADILMIRAAGDRDGFPVGDLVLRRALGGVTEKEALAMSAAWSPYRAYALFQLWASTGIHDL